MNGITTNNSIKSVKKIEEKKREAVRELQKYLLALSRAGMEIPRLRIDGVYGDMTRETVRLFQALMGIPVTGIVDIITWNIIYSEYLAAMEQNGMCSGIFPFEEVFTGGSVSKGFSGNIVYILQIMLETVALYYDEMVKQTISGFFDGITEENLKEFQLRNNMEPTGVLDKITWNALSRAYNEALNRE